jgi:hypothetical protein
MQDLVSEKKRALSADEIVEEILTLCGDPPLLENEDIEDYLDMLTRLVQAKVPTNGIELICMNDVAHHTWDILRYRKFKRLITMRGVEQARSKLVNEMSETPAFDNQGEKKRKQLLHKFIDDNKDIFVAEGFIERLGDLERIERLIVSAESRRNNVLREIELHRKLVAMRLRETSDTIIEESEQITFVPSDAPENERAVELAEPTPISGPGS